MHFQGGRPASIWVVFINLGGACGREGKCACEPGFIDLALCFAFPVAVSLEGQMTLSRRLLLMKTTRFLAGPFNNCAHPGIGAARDKSPDPLSPPCLPCLATRVLLRRPSATDSHRVYCPTYGNRAASACLAARRGPSRLLPHSHPHLSLCTISVGKHWASVSPFVPSALA